MFLHVENAKYLNNYKLELKFNNNEIKNVDLENELYGDIFEPLKQISYFKDFLYLIIL